ncbi:MAG: Uroporphyrinogen-III synthase (EC [uncultured Thiotrichaceae bacterium]|uniref:Uroporphyrinogen-III synthase n=1 Tax=uncultured Thiotrichaceae bacterium TaxID=298394 RepID=A0A6S6UGH2_9GAMM|nr:MAG: Uroporphyrinogen-III synthase (EC [uncultured Thiotrichaceae bacterium]
MEISATTPSHLHEIDIKQLDVVIFISANAVTFSQNHFNLSQFPSACSIAAIGEKTTRTLSSSGYTVDLIADPPFNSEALLASPSMQNIQGQRILIIKGCDGRKTLENTLKSRGARVKTYDVYERKIATHSVKSVNSICNSSQIDIIAITSFDSANYLFDFFRDCVVFKHKPLLVGSQRIADALTDMNIANPLVIAKNPSDECMLETLIKWIKNR